MIAKNSTELPIIPADKSVAGATAMCRATALVYQQPTDVRWAIPPWCRSLGLLDALERKRQAYWHNDPRNDFITQISSAIATGDAEKLWQLGLFLDEDGTKMAHFPAVAVLVESTEHGRELLRRLPGWRLLNRTPGSKQVLAAGARLDKVIFTLARAGTLPTIDTDVVIRADGGPWPLNLPQSTGRSTAQGAAPVIVDVADDADKFAKAATRRRHESYVARGWAIVEGPSWLTARPHVREIGDESPGLGPASTLRPSR